jgi:hypothetical protein
MMIGPVVESTSSMVEWLSTKRFQGMKEFDND